MDLIQKAIRKAKAAEDRDGSTRSDGTPGGAASYNLMNPGGWSPPEVVPDEGVLEKNRIVSFAMKDPSHVSFNLLRTKVYKALKDNRWRTLAVTSPTPGCGKTVVSLNLAFSLARQPSCRTVLIDLDLSRSGVARTVGLQSKGSIGHYLRGDVAFEDCFVRVGQNLTLGLNVHYLKNASELMHEERLRDLQERVIQLLAPDVILFDLPPMLVTDEAIAVLPTVDASLLVIAAGTTTAPQVQECERHVAGRKGFLGLVLNKCGDVGEVYY